jgi:hypothetical protein
VSVTVRALRQAAALIAFSIATLLFTLRSVPAAPRVAQAPAPASLLSVSATAPRVTRTAAALLRDARAEVVSALAVDLDHDGDLDVVATDAALDLLVWVNDGGQLIRRRPDRLPGWQDDVPPPGLDESPSESIASIESGQLSGEAGFAPAIVGPARACDLTPCSSPSPTCTPILLSSPRAPPRSDLHA